MPERPAPDPLYVAARRVLGSGGPVVGSYGAAALARMHQKRLAGYRAMGYTVEDEAEHVEHLAF